MDNKKIHIVSGGTFSHVRCHLALAAPAFGETGRKLFDLCRKHIHQLDTVLHETRMAAGSSSKLITNEDVEELVGKLAEDPATKIIFMPVALCDFTGTINDVPSGKYAPRLKSREEDGATIKLHTAKKILNSIRSKRKDIFLVGFKTTDGLTEDEQYISGLNLLKSSSCNMVFVNDVATRLNMIVTPEEARYHVDKHRDYVLQNLVDMAKMRSHLTFTRSTVVAGEPVAWGSPMVPESLRKVVDFCIDGGAYKPFRGATVGHFACKVASNEFLTSIRKTNFNKLSEIGLVRVTTDGPDSVFAYGAKPSVGGQSQRIVFSDHPEYDCIVHFHSPKKENSQVPTVSQREVECGSHQCGKNTSSGLKKFGNLSAVYLDNHGPNIVFNRSIDPQEVIDFINDNFNLDEKTGGYVSLGQILKTPDHLDDLVAYHE